METITFADFALVVLIAGSFSAVIGGVMWWLLFDTSDD